MCIINNREEFVKNEILPTIEGFENARRKFDLISATLHDIGIRMVPAPEAHASIVTLVVPFIQNEFVLMMDSIARVYENNNLAHEVRYLKQQHEVFCDYVENILSMLRAGCFIAAFDVARSMGTLISRINDSIAIAYECDRMSFKRVAGIYEYQR